MCTSSVRWRSQLDRLTRAHAATPSKRDRAIEIVGDLYRVHYTTAGEGPQLHACGCGRSPARSTAIADRMPIACVSGGRCSHFLLSSRDALFGKRGGSPVSSGEVRAHTRESHAAPGHGSASNAAAELDNDGPGARGGLRARPAPYAARAAPRPVHLVRNQGHATPRKQRQPQPSEQSARQQQSAASRVEGQ